MLIIKGTGFTIKRSSASYETFLMALELIDKLGYSYHYYMDESDVEYIVISENKKEEKRNG